MATGLWISLYQAIEKHPKTLQLAQKTGWTIHETIGKLVCLWFWALDYAEDGDLNKYQPYIYLTQLRHSGTPDELYKLLQLPVEGTQGAGFITENGLINNWLDYVGKYLISKYKTSNPNKLKVIWKKHKTPLRRSLGGHKGSLKAPYRHNIPDLYLPNLQTNNHFEKLYASYPKKVGRKAAERHFHASVKTDQDIKDIYQALGNYMRSKRVADGRTQDAKTWFNDWRSWIDFTEDVCKQCNDTGRFTSGTGFKNLCTCPAGQRLKEPHRAP